MLDRSTEMSCCYILLLITTSLALAQEIRIESLDNGPGLLPFQLGKTKIISHHHSFIFNIRLNEMQLQVTNLKTQLNNISNKLSNANFIFFKYQILHLYNKLDKISKQLEIFRPTTRVKRGLIDPLGSIIKSITGNLDHDDALKFENAIKIIRNDNQKIADSLNHHMTLFKEMSLQQSQVLKTLKSNQDTLALSLSKVINMTHTDSSSLLQITHFSQLFIILNENVQELLNELNKIENMLAFSRKRSVHHSILSINDLKSMISDLSKIYSSKELIDLDIRYYYDILSIGSYFTDKKLVVIIKFPITYPKTYNLFRLCPVPNANFSIILPPYPYLATDSQEFMYIAAECPKVDTWFICEQNTYHQSRTQEDCVHHLLQHQNLLASCNTKRISMSKEALTKLDDQHYVISFPVPTYAHLSCHEDLHRTLRGSYLVILPHTCKIKTKEFTIANIDNRIRGKAIEISAYSNISNSKTMEGNFNLKTIDLSALQNIENQVMMEPPVQVNSDTTILHTTIPFYALIIIGAAVLAIICIRKRMKKNNTVENEISLEDRRAATFSLDIGK